MSSMADTQTIGSITIPTTSYTTSSWVSNSVTEEQFKAWTAKLLSHIEDLHGRIRSLEDRLDGR